MKKMNNKGVTLVELIVSFAIVSVAIIYFYQTVSTVSKLYTTSKKDTNEYANSTYVLRLMDAYCNEDDSTKYSCGDAKTTEQIEKIKAFCKKLDNSCEITEGLGGGNGTAQKRGYKYYNELTIKLNGNNQFKLLASVTPPVTYEINFYNATKATLLKSVSTTSWNYDTTVLQTPSNFNTNKWRVSSFSSTNINYKYYFIADNGYIVNFGNVVSRSDMENKAEKIEYEGAITYKLDVKVVNGNLFSYSGNYNLSYESNTKDWAIKFLTNGTLILNSTINIDGFLVGGGSAGANSPQTYYQRGGGGGAGGDTLTLSNHSLAKGSYVIEIGTGGTEEGTGGDTKAFSNTASGADAIDAIGRGRQYGAASSGSYSSGGDGGYKTTDSPKCGGAGVCAFGDCTKYGKYASGGAGGSGQLSKRYWSGTLSCDNSGGIGGTNNNSGDGAIATANTGSGGGGAAARYGIGGTRYSGGSGSSGIVIIRNAR